VGAGRGGRFSGTWSGLLAMLTLVMHPMLREMEGRDFAINWLRAVITWTAFGLLLAALVGSL
jgi:hypothetical protein